MVAAVQINKMISDRALPIEHDRSDKRLEPSGRTEIIHYTGLHIAKLCWFLRATAECFACLRAIVWASVRLSVCPSGTLVICIKTMQAKITKSFLWLPQGI